MLRPLSVFINQGVAGFDAMTLKMKNQADMQTKITEIMSGTKMQWETLTGTIANVVAHTGAVISKVAGLTGIMKTLNNLAGKLDSWIMANPKTAGTIAGIAIAVTGAALAIGGLLLAIGLGGTLVLKMTMGYGLLLQGIVLVKAALAGLIPVVWSFTAALFANPLTWIVVAIVAAVAALTWLYTKFEAVRTAVDFFNFFLGFLIGNLLKLATLSGWLNLFKSGQQLVSTLVDGIKSKAASAVDAIKGIFQKIRNMLPFSDAKEGPLSQLTLSGQRIMSTLGEGITGAAGGLQKTMATALAGAALTTSIAVQPPAGFGSAQPPAARSLSGVEGQRSEGKKIVIQIGKIELPGVSNGADLVKQLQALVEGYDAE
jgi:hypothetical protein